MHLNCFLWHCCTDIFKERNRNLQTSKLELPQNIHPSAILALKAENVSKTQRDEVEGPLHKGANYTSFKPSANAQAWNSSSGGPKEADGNKKQRKNKELLPILSPLRDHC